LGISDAGSVGAAVGAGSAPQATTRKAAIINITTVVRFMRNPPLSIKDDEL
jgi:hypothetical protein